MYSDPSMLIEEGGRLMGRKNLLWTRWGARKRQSSTGRLFIWEELLLPSESFWGMTTDTHLTDRFFADILLTPLEATRIRLVSDRNVGYVDKLCI
jgi:hypothetical protein